MTRRSYGRSRWDRPSPGPTPSRRARGWSPASSAPPEERLALAALGGFVLLIRRAREGSPSRALAAGICAAALYVPVLSAVIAVNGRYRRPVEDAIMPLAGLLLARATSGPLPVRER